MSKISRKKFHHDKMSKGHQINGRRIYPFSKGLRIYEGVHHSPFDTLKVHIKEDNCL